MAKILVYSTKICPYCERAKALLNKKGLSYEEIYIDENPKEREVMMQLTGRRTVPQIIINGQPVGGFDDIYALERSGKLDEILNNGAEK